MIGEIQLKKKIKFCYTNVSPFPKVSLISAFLVKFCATLEKFGGEISLTDK